MTAILDHETLTGVDDSTRQKLADAADAYEQAPASLRAAIIEAARSGDRPRDIVRAIRYVFTYDYVARLVRLDRKENPGAYPAPEPPSVP